jgi:adenylate cyclase class 2
MIEVEIRAKIKDIDSVKEHLGLIDAQFVDNIEQIDRIFGHPKFLDKETKIIEGGLSARIRQVNNSSKLEFKEIIRDGGGFEIEAKLDNIDSGIELLEKLDFKEAFTISKTRDVYKYNDFEIAIDQVEQLGSFIEIEKMVNSKEEINKAREDCLELLDKISSDAEITNEKYGDMMQNIINKNKN